MSNVRQEYWPSNANVAVLGAGISGLTTALVLQSCGYRTVVIAEERPLQRGETNSLVPTSFAMASAYPHNLRVDNLEEVSRLSQLVFKHLHEAGQFGVEVHKIYEVFEDEPPPPPMAAHRMKFHCFDGTPNQMLRHEAPVRPGAQYLWGWHFHTYFADMPIFLASLWRLFEARGGAFITRRISSTEPAGEATMPAGNARMPAGNATMPTDNARMPADNATMPTGYTNQNRRQWIDETLPAGTPVINCLGIGALQVFADRVPVIAMRGKQAFAPGAPRVVSAEGTPLAYNYTPKAEHFPRADGKAEYLHFFSRSDGWVLGQTREEGSLDEEGNWYGASVNCSGLRLGATDIPLPIVQLNKQLLLAWKNLSLKEEGLIGKEGIRYYRDPADRGVRLEQDESITERLLIHNYGHGGSGVTMSWGCALEAVRLLQNQFKPTVSSGSDDLLHQLLKVLS